MRSIEDIAKEAADSPEREEHVKCVMIGTKDEPRTSWCGRPMGGFEFAFFDANHAALNGRSGGRLTTCPACAAAIGAALSDDGFLTRFRAIVRAEALEEAGLRFAGWFSELPSAMSYRLWEQGGHEQRPGDVALYEAPHA